MLYHHARPLDYAPYGIVTQARGIGSDFEGAYEWLERQVGFYPLFLSVGFTPDAFHMTGYPDQWRRKLGHNSYRAAGEIDNEVLFSFEVIPNGVFMDYDCWHQVLNSRDYLIPPSVCRSIFRYSWSRSDWVRTSRRSTKAAQLVVPSLDLRQARRVWVRNKSTEALVQRRGFENATVKRMPVPRW